MQVKAGGGIIQQTYSGDLCEDKKFNGKQFGAAAKTPLDGTAAHMKACQGRECHWPCVGKWSCRDYRQASLRQAVRAPATRKGVQRALRVSRTRSVLEKPCVVMTRTLVQARTASSSRRTRVPLGGCGKVVVLRLSTNQVMATSLRASNSRRTSTSPRLA